MGNKKCLLIFSGFNQRAVVSFLRTLDTNQLDFAIIALPDTDSIFSTKYSEKVLAVRKHKALILDDLLNAIKTAKAKLEADEYIIAPTTEALIRFLLEHRAVFEENNCKIPLVNKELYESISNKHTFGNICKAHGITVPEEIDIHDEIVFPIVAKPKEYYSAANNEILSPVIINDRNEFNLFISQFSANEFYYQEYVDGSSYYLLYYFHTSGDVYKFSQENLIQQPGGKSILAAIPSNIHNSAESEKYEALFKALNFFGLVMIEVKQHHHLNYMIEANPRFWGPSQLFVDAGANLFEAFLHDVGLLDTLEISKEIDFMIKYFWFGGFETHLESSLNKVTLYHYTIEDFYNEFWELLGHDIYYREDTKNIFAHEVFNLKGMDRFGKY